MTDKTVLDYPHTERVTKFWDYYNFYVQGDTYLLDDVFENFRNMRLEKCLEKYGLDPIKFGSTPVLVCEALLKKTKVKLDCKTDINILIMIGKEKLQ